MSTRWQPPAIPLLWLTMTAFFIVEAACLWMYHFSWYGRESIKFVATVMGGAFGLFVYLKNIESIRNQTAERFIERWNKPDVRSIVDRTRPFVEGTLDSSQYARPTYESASASPERSQLRCDMITILGFFEEIAIAVITRTADEDKLKRFFGSVIPGGYDGFQGFVLAERKQDRDPAYYNETQGLVERWTKVKRPEMRT